MKSKKKKKKYFFFLFFLKKLLFYTSFFNKYIHPLISTPHIFTISILIININSIEIHANTLMKFQEETESANSSNRMEIANMEINANSSTNKEAAVTMEEEEIIKEEVKIDQKESAIILLRMALVNSVISANTLMKPTEKKIT